MSDQNGSERINRIEAALELLINDHVQFREEHKMLLTAQVLLTGTLQGLAEQSRALAEQTRALTLRVDGLTERLETLALAVFNLTGNVKQLTELIGDHAKDPNAHKETR